MSQVLDSLYANYSGRASTPRQLEVLENQEGPVANEAVTPSGLAETFDRGFGAGIEGIRTDTDYLKGLYNTVTGDSEAAAINIQAAREREARIAESLSGLETFEEFVENPTFDGFISQFGKIGGQVAPYALTTISSGGSGAAVSILGKGALTAGSRSVAKNIIKESMERAARGEATPDEKDLAELSYRLAQRSLPGRAANQITATRGAIGGQLLEEYSLMAGANFGENLEVEGLSDQEAAYRALAVAAPQAVIGVAGERLIQGAIFNKLGKITEARGASDSLMANLGKEIAKATGKGAASEAVAETTQEGLQIANIMQADPTYQAQDAYMRLAESAFSGAIGGGGMSGAGRTTTGSLQAAGGVMSKAKQFIEEAREQQVNRQYNQEQYGVDESGYTTQEPLADMAAQKRSFQDTTTARNSLWIAGSRPEMGATADSISAIEIEGQKAYARYVPGRGTIVSKDYDTVEAVANAEASDASLQIALGYSAVKPADADISIEARDADNNVVWAEATNEQGEAAARAAAAKQMPAGGRVNRQSLKAALEERAKAVRDEQGPQVRNMDVPQDVQDAFREENQADAQPDADTDQNQEITEEAGVQDTGMFGEGVQEGGIVTNDVTGAKPYKPNDGRERDDTSAAQTEFAEAFKDEDLPELGKDQFTPVDFKNPAFGNMSSAFLRRAARVRRENPGAINPVINQDGTYSLFQTIDPLEPTYKDSRIEDPLARPNGQKVEQGLAKTARQVLRVALTKAAKSDFAKKIYGGKKSATNKQGYRNKTEAELVKVNNKPVNLVDLVADGMRMLSYEKQTAYTDGGQFARHRAGFIKIATEILADGRSLTIGGATITVESLKPLAALMENVRLAEDYANAFKDFLVGEGIDMDPGVPPDLNQLEQELSALEQKVAAQPTLAKLVRESKAYAKSYSEFMKSPEKQAHIKAVEEYKAAKEAGDKDVVYPEGPKGPEKTGTLKLMDTVIGFQEQSDKGAKPKTITLGKALRTETRMPRDRQYEVVDVAGQTIFEGNRDEVIAFNESTTTNYASDNKVYRPERTRNDGTVEPRQEVTDLSDEPTVDGYEVEMGFVAEMDPDRTDNDNFDTESMNAFARSNPGAQAARSTVGLEAFGLTPDSLVSKVFKNAGQILGLKKPTSIFNVDQLIADDSKVTELFGSPEVLAYVKDVAQELKADPQGGGRYIGFGDAHIILVDPEVATNELDTALIAAHELGHALFKEQLSSTLQNPALYNRLFNKFQQARDDKNAPASYKGKHGFEEWYADQTAVWAMKAYKKEKAKGLVEKTFERLAAKLNRFYKALSRDMKQRFGAKAYSPDFDGYMAEVVKRRTASDKQLSGAAVATMQEKVIVRKMAEVIEKQQPGVANAIIRQAKRVIESDNFTPIYNFLITADSRMRKVGGNKLADMFYGRAQQAKGRGKTKLGFIKAHALEANARYSRLEDMIDGDLSSPEVQDSIREAFTDTPTRDLEDPNAIAVRKWFDEFYDEYIDPSTTEVGRRRDYAPVVLNLSEIDNNPEGLVKLILESDRTADEADVRRAVQKLVNYQQAVMDDVPITIKETNPAQSAEKAIKLTKKVGREKLQKAGFLEEPDVALMRYTSNMIKRVEWNRNTKDSAGTSIYEEELKKLSPEARKEVELIVHKYLGYTDKPLGPVWRAINSWGSLLQIVAILPLATLGSLPELAGPVIASKEFGAVTLGMKEIVNTVRNREEARQLARDLGVVTSQSVANVMMSQAELDFMDSGARKLTDGFFRITLLDTYTKFTREFASNMGVRFLMNHSDPETAGAFSTRYLEELGLTAAEVQAWSKSNQDFSTPEGKKVREGLQRFVESSTLRPNSAERPLWASDPRWALAWQLKGFFYSYGKVMLAGAKREASARLDGASAQDVNTYAAMTGAAGVFALMGIATMPLAMVGMELREYAKFGLAWAIPGIDHEAKNYFRTDDMSWGTYMGAAFDRSFAAGPVTIAQQAMQAADWGRGVTGAAAVVAGPTAETIERTFSDGFSSTFENRMLPTGLL